MSAATLEEGEEQDEMRFLHEAAADILREVHRSEAPAARRKMSAD